MSGWRRRVGAPMRKEVLMLDVIRKHKNIILIAGLVSIIVITLALVTPPVAMSLFIASSIADVAVERIFKAAVPLLCLNLMVVLIIIFWPELYMWVPISMGFSE